MWEFKGRNRAIVSKFNDWLGGLDLLCYDEEELAWCAWKEAKEEVLKILKLEKQNKTQTGIGIPIDYKLDNVIEEIKKL